LANQINQMVDAMRTTGKATNDKILTAARQLIERRGYSNFSYADVSAAVSVHKASIHHHFPTKASLALAVTRYSQEVFEADMAAIAVEKPEPAAQLQAYLDYWEHKLIHDPEAFCIAGMLGAEVPFLEADVARAVGEYFAVIESWLENLLSAGAASGRFRLGEPVRDEAAALLSLVYGAVLVARATRNPAYYKQATRAAIARLTGTAA
jgi:TetR/AcrR family transcriptional repressor of nem operon